MVELWVGLFDFARPRLDKSAFRKPKFLELIFGVYGNTDTAGYGKKPFH
jgi:hypothetical protein